MIYAKKRKLKIFHLNGISANFCCFIIGDLSPLLPEPVTYTNFLTRAAYLIGLQSKFHRKCLLEIGSRPNLPRVDKCQDDEGSSRMTLLSPSIYEIHQLVLQMFAPPSFTQCVISMGQS